MAITQDQLVIKIGAETKELVEALDKLQTKTIGLDGATDELQGSIKSLSKTEMEYVAALNKANSSSESSRKAFEDMNIKADELAKSMNAANTVLQAMNLPEDELKNFNDTLTAVTRSVDIFKASVTIFGNVKATFDAIFNPETIELANKLLYILQAYAAIKGFDKLADSIETARQKLNLLSEAVDKFRFLTTEGLTQAIDSTAGLSKAFLVVSSIIKTAISAIVASFLAISGYSIFKTFMEDGLNLGKIISGLGNTFRSVFTGISANIAKAGSVFAGFKLSIQDIKLSITDLYKLFAVGGLSLGSLASGIDDSTLASLALSQTLSFSSAALIALSLAIRIVLVAVGTFIEAIGDKIISAMDLFAEKFAKTQQIAVQFGFVVANFGKAYGSQFIGTLSQWEAQIERLAETTTFSGGEIRKATKLIIAENQALGLSYEENVKFLDRAVEIASSSGLELIDVVQRLQSAMLGNSTAVAVLGINLSSHALEHSVLNKTMQKTVGTMSSLEKQQIALAEIYRQTEPLVGAAIVQGQTIIGINKQIANSYGSIQSKIGAVNFFSIELSKTYAGLLRSVDKLPDIFFAIFGGLTDLLGVTLKVVGITVQWLLIIGGLTTAYKLLNIAIATNLAFQTALNTAFAKLGLSLAINVTAVTSAATAFTVLTTLLKGGFMIILANVGKVLVGVTAKILAFTGAILINPIFLGGVGIVLAVGAVIKALQELNEEFQIIKISMVSLSDVSDLLSGVFTGLGSVISGAFNAVVQSVKIVVLSFAEIYQYAVLLRLAFKKVFDPQSGENYNEQIDATLQKLDMLTAAHEKALDSMAFGFLGANEKIALNAKLIDQSSKAMDELAFKQKQLQKASESIDINTIRIDILGTEVQKLTNKYSNAAKEAKKFSDEVLSSTDVNIEAVNGYKKALEDQASAGFQLDKMRIDSLKGLSDIMKDVQKGSMKNNEDETAAIIAGFDERREAVKEFEKVLANLGPISTESASKIKAAYAVIAQAQKEALNAAQKKREDEAIAETIKVIKEEADALKTIADRNREIGKATAGERLTAQQKIVSDLQIELQSLDERLYLERASRGNNSEIVKALELQKILRTQNAEVQKRMTDMEFPDWIDQLGVALEKAFAFDAAQNFFSFIEDGMKRIKDSEIVVNIKKKITETKESLGMGEGGAVSNAMSSVGDAVIKAGELAKAAGGTLISGIAKAGGWVGQVIDVIINADKYLKALIEMPKMLLQVIKNLPALIDEIVSSFPDMIGAIAEALPSILISLADKIPAFIEAIAKSLPNLVQKLAEALPEILVQLIGNLPKIMVLLARAAVDMALGLIKGLIKGIGNLLKGIKLPKMQVDTKGMQKELKKLSGATGGMFKVSDLTDAVKDPVKDMMKGIEETFKKGTNWIKQAWQWVMDKIINPLFNGIKAVWDGIIGLLKGVWYVAKQIFDGIIQAFSQLWEVAKQIFSALWEAAKQIFQVVVNLFSAVWEVAKQIFNGIIQSFSAIWQAAKQIFNAVIESFSYIWESAKGAFTWIFDMFSKVWDGLTSAVSNAFSFLTNIGNTIAKPIKEAFTGITDFFKNIGDAFKSLFKFDFSGFASSMATALDGALQPIFKILKVPVNAIIDLINSLKLPGFEVGFKVLGKKVSFGWGETDLVPGEIQRLAKGGMVTGTDTVPAMLTPGEFIMSRPAVNQIGLNNLRSMNAGQGMGAGNNTYNIEFEINIDAKTTMDEGFIRGTLIPRMQDEMKRASLEGKFVLSQKGIR